MAVLQEVTRKKRIVLDLQTEHLHLWEQMLLFGKNLIWSEETITTPVPCYQWKDLLKDLWKL